MNDAQLIDKFCSTLDAQYLEELTPEAQQLITQLSVIGMKKGTKRYVARKILYFYGLDDKGQPLSEPKQYPRKHAEATLAAFSTALTGARPNDVLIGKSNASKGAILRMLGQPVYPQRKSVARLRGYPDLWQQYLMKLGGVPFFTTMSIKEREHWININEDPSDISIGEAGEKVELLQPGTSDFVKKLSDDDLEMLMVGKDGGWTSAEIEALFPGKPGSKARKHTLIMFRGMWKLAIDHQIEQDWKGLAINVADGVVGSCPGLTYVLDDITKDYIEKSGKWVRPVGKKGVQKIGFCVPEQMTPITDELIDELISELYATVDVTPIRAAMTNFTGAAYKSLLQKLIRFRAVQVELPDGELWDTQVVLLVTMGELAKYPGSFVPDIQRYVTGMESLAKRLAVSIFEDSSVADEDGLVSALSGALVAQRIKVWTPSRALLKKWMEIGLESVANPVAYRYNWKQQIGAQPLTIKKDSTALELCSALLDELRSFGSDLAMVRDLARQTELSYTPPLPNIAPQPEIMPLLHCVDQHWVPNIVYFFDPQVAKEAMQGSPPNAPFHRLIWKIFKEVTGMNYRRSYDSDPAELEDQPFVKATRAAQSLVLTAKQIPHHPRKVTGSTIQLKYTLDIGWLAGMIGALEVKGTPLALVTLRSDDPLQLVVIRRPSREMKDSSLPPKRHEDATKLAREMLKKGVPLNKTQAPAPLFIGAKAYLVESEEDPSDDYYVIETATGEHIPWDEARELVLHLPVHPKEDYNPHTALISVGTGVTKDAEKLFDELLENTSANTLRRVVMYLSGFSSFVEMHRVSRDGGGVHHAVVYEDVPTLHFLLQMSWLYPGALRPAEFTPGKFNIPVGPLLWTLVEKLRSRLAKAVTTKVAAEWKKIKLGDTLKRKLWTHQKDALQDMKDNHRAGGKGTFISIPVGLGKTAIVMSYLVWLRNQGQLPKNIIYTLPQSAIKSVIKEIQAFGFKVELLIPLKNIKGKPLPKGVTVTQTCQPKAYTVTMLEHDYLRRCESELVRVAPNAVFIIDEVHKALNDTKRTSVALEISHLSREFIALTGTPVIDSKTYKLIWWLSQVVPFEVNERNFWVAANSMIAKKASTGVIVNREEVLALFNKVEEKMYTETVPPALGGTNTSPSSEDWQAATAASYSACTREMVVQTAAFLKKGRGVMLVAKDTKHQTELYKATLKGTKLKAEQIFVLGSSDSIFLTDDAVEKEEVPDYRVVIVPIRKAEGYTLTRLSAMVCSVYPSNNATREQIEGRINRIGQKSKTVEYRIVHAGILTRILQHHNDAKSLSLALQSIADEIK